MTSRIEVAYLQSNSLLWFLIIGFRVPRTCTDVRFHVYIFQIHVQKIGTVREMHVRFFFNFTYIVLAKILRFFNWLKKNIAFLLIYEHLNKCYLRSLLNFDRTLLPLHTVFRKTNGFQFRNRLQVITLKVKRSICTPIFVGLKTLGTQKFWTLGEPWGFPSVS